MEFNVPVQFSDTPGARYKSQGPYSGELFRNDYLLPMYNKVRNSSEMITIVLDGAYGYPDSFLEEAFGGLARIYPQDRILEKFTFISNDEPKLLEDISEYVKRQI